MIRLPHVKYQPPRPGGDGHGVSYGDGVGDALDAGDCVGVNSITIDVGDPVEARVGCGCGPYRRPKASASLTLAR